MSSNGLSELQTLLHVIPIFYCFILNKFGFAGGLVQWGGCWAKSTLPFKSSIVNMFEQSEDHKYYHNLIPKMILKHICLEFIDGMILIYESFLNSITSQRERNPKVVST